MTRRAEQAAEQARVETIRECADWLRALAEYGQARRHRTVRDGWIRAADELDEYADRVARLLTAGTDDQ